MGLSGHGNMERRHGGKGGEDIAQAGKIDTCSYAIVDGLLSETGLLYASCII